MGPDGGSFDERKKLNLPPLLENFEDGKAKWKRFDEIDFEVIGFFLSCHLVIEHYLDEFLVAYSPAPFDWDSANLNFGQKVSLISTLKQFPEPYTIPSALKHFNSLRNKLSHNVKFVVSIEVLLPEIQFLQKIISREKSTVLMDLTDIKSVLDTFTGMVCVYFASAITHCAEQKHNGMNGVWKL
ncbi:hypothetical protein ACIPIX_05375 [Pseudomonas protegens]|uniref:hypothetical protein n=1 Tax=Pseudomonas protegens TaxID=380021 RepID=UPI0038242BDA